MKRLLAASIVLTLTLLATSAFATTLLKLDLATMTAKSERIVHGTVKQIEPRKEGGRIFTHVTLEAREHLKGEAEDEVTFRLLGGRMGDLVTIVHGSPDFALGEEVVVFLERPKGSEHLVVTGMSQGKFRVAVGPDAHTLYVVPQLENTPLVEQIELRDEEGNLRRRLRQAAPSTSHSQVTSLEDFKERVRAQLR